MIKDLLHMSAQLCLCERGNVHFYKALILLYSGGSFMQLIEGKESAVQALYEKIRQDHRHRDVTLLFREKITQKNFDNWLMGYRNIDNLKKIDPDLLTPFLDEDLNFASYIKNPHHSLQFLEVFKKIVS